MKYNLIIAGFFSFTLMFGSSCMNASSDSKPNSDTLAQTTGTLRDSTGSSTPQSEAAKDSVAAPTASQKVKVYWYVSGTNPETGEVIPATREEFKPGKNFYCPEGMSFEKMVITGDAEGIVLVVGNSDGQIFKSEPFNAGEKRAFKQFGKLSIDEVSRTDKFEIRQNDKVLFKATIEYVGCH